MHNLKYQYCIYSYTPVTNSRNMPTEEPRINSGIVRSYPYWSVALRIVAVINRSSHCISEHAQKFATDKSTVAYPC
jgi:hypothetical protein